MSIKTVRNVNDSFDYWRPLLLYMYKMGKGYPFPKAHAPSGLTPSSNWQLPNDILMMSLI